MKKHVLTCCALMILAASAMAQPQLDTLRHVHPRPGTGLSAIWGYTGPDGREYALVGITGNASVSGGTSIVDITEDVNPRTVTHIVGPNSTWRELKTYQHYAYVVTEATSATGVQIIDLSSLPDTATLVRTFGYSSGTKNINRSHTISIHDGFMYLNGCANWGTQTGQHGIVIFDLRNDPLNPQFVGEYIPDYVHDCYVLRDTIYASAVYATGGLFIADARDKANVQTIGRIAYTGSGTHNAWVTRDRRYAMTTDEIGTTQKNLKVWDIGNLPTIPTTTSATFTVDPTSTIHNVHIRGDFAYCAWYNGYGLQIVDISNPTLPSLAAGYRTSASSLAWETYPYFPSGKLIIGDGSTGLWIFRFSELAPRLPVQLLEPANNDTVFSNASTIFRWTKSADIERDPHYYEVRLRGPGVDTTWRSDDSVTVLDDPGLLPPGGSYWWSVTTRDEWNTTVSPDSFLIIRGVTTDVVESNVPRTVSLSQNYPNPFNPTTVIRYELPAQAAVSLKVFNVLGQEVANLVNTTQAAGRYQVTVDGSTLASGLYIYTLKAGGFFSTMKMVLTK